MTKKNGPALYDVSSLIQAGIDPKTGLPIKMTQSLCNTPEEIRKALRIKDEQTAINRYEWNNLPNGLDGHLLERILYYKGQLAFFYMPEDDNYYILPYALSGTIDVYGRYKKITPLPFNGTAKDEKDAWIVGLYRYPVYDIDKEEEFDKENSCVLLHDYAKQISQTVLPRSLLQEPLLNLMSEAFPMARTSLLANSGIQGMRVSSEDEGMNVAAAGQAIATCALRGQIWAPIIGAPGLEELTGKGTANQAEEYFLYYQSLDNERLSWYGLENGGAYQKKAHMLQMEQEMNNSNNNLIYQDGLKLREKFCEFVNKIFGLNISVSEIQQDMKEAIINGDFKEDDTIDDNRDFGGNDDE